MADLVIKKTIFCFISIPWQNFNILTDYGCLVKALLVIHTVYVIVMKMKITTFVQDYTKSMQLVENAIYTSILLNKIQSRFVCFEWTRKRLDGF